MITFPVFLRRVAIATIVAGSVAILRNSCTQQPVAFYGGNQKNAPPPWIIRNSFGVPMVPGT